MCYLRPTMRLTKYTQLNCQVALRRFTTLLFTCIVALLLGSRNELPWDIRSA